MLSQAAEGHTGQQLIKLVWSHARQSNNLWHLRPLKSWPAISSETTDPLRLQTPVQDRLSKPMSVSLPHCSLSQGPHLLVKFFLPRSRAISTVQSTSPNLGVSPLSTHHTLYAFP